MPTHGLHTNQHTQVHKVKPPKAQTHIGHLENSLNGYVTFPHHSYCFLQYTEPSTISHCDENFSTHISAFTYHSLYNIISSFKNCVLLQWQKSNEKLCFI